MQRPILFCGLISGGVGTS